MVRTELQDKKNEDTNYSYLERMRLTKNSQEMKMKTENEKSEEREDERLASILHPTIHT